MACGLEASSAALVGLCLRLILRLINEASGALMPDFKVSFFFGGKVAVPLEGIPGPRMANLPVLLRSALTGGGVVVLPLLRLAPKLRSSFSVLVWLCLRWTGRAFGANFCNFVLSFCFRGKVAVRLKGIPGLRLANLPLLPRLALIGGGLVPVPLLNLPRKDRLSSPTLV